MSAAAEVLRMPDGSRAQFASLFENAPLPMLMCDEEGNVTATNPAADQMLPPRDKGKPSVRFPDLVQAPDRLELERLLLACAARDLDTFQLETKTAASGRTIRWTAWKLEVSSRSSVSMLALGEPLGGESGAQDRLRQAQRLELLGRLASGVAHDINNLLTGVLLYSDLLMASLDAGHTGRKYAEEIRKVGFQATGVVRQLLALAKPSGCPPRLFSLNEVAEGMKDLLTRLIGGHIGISFHLDAGLGLVRMDPTQVQQILLNLVLNARDALPQGGEVRVETGNCKLQVLPDVKRDDAPRISCALLVVSDNGYGMDEATRARLFEPFLRPREEKEMVLAWRPYTRS